MVTAFIETEKEQEQLGGGVRVVNKTTANNSSSIGKIFLLLLNSKEINNKTKRKLVLFFLNVPFYVSLSLSVKI